MQLTDGFITCGWVVVASVSGQQTRWTCLSTAIKFSKFLKFCVVSLHFLSLFLFHNGCACYTR